jgi:3-hydroxybutyryl-CoA dehydrogenase
MKDLCNDTKVPSELAKFYEEGHLGIKSQQGFYDYHDGKDHQAIKNI